MMLRQRVPALRWTGVSAFVVLIALGSSLAMSDSERRYKFETTRVAETHQGAAASRVIQELVEKNPHAREIRRSILERLGSRGASHSSSVVVQHVKKTTAIPIDRGGLIGVLDRLFNDEVHAQVFESWDGTTITTPFEFDGNDYSAEFNLWYIHPDGLQIAQDLLVYTPSNDVYSLGNEQGYDPYGDTGPEGQTRGEGRHWRGISCNDGWGLHNEFNRSASDHVRNALFTMAGAAVPCIGFTYGWPICVNGAYWGHVMAGLAYDRLSQMAACYGG